MVPGGRFGAETAALRASLPLVPGPWAARPVPAWDAVPAAVPSPAFGSIVPARMWPCGVLPRSRAASLFISPELHKVGTGFFSAIVSDQQNGESERSARHPVCGLLICATSFRVHSGGEAVRGHVAGYHSGTRSPEWVGRAPRSLPEGKAGWQLSVGINPAWKGGGSPVSCPRSWTQVPFQPLGVGFSLLLCPGRGKALLTDGEGSPGEGEASRNFFHMKHDICFGMTQAGSHRPRGRGGRAPTQPGWARPAGLHPFTLARGEVFGGVMTSLNRPVPESTEFRAPIASLGAGGTRSPCQGCDGRQRLRQLWCSASLPAPSPFPTAAPAAFPHRDRVFVLLQPAADCGGLLSASGGTLKPQRKASAQDLAFYPKSAGFERHRLAKRRKKRPRAGPCALPCLAEGAWERARWQGDGPILPRHIVQLPPSAENLSLAGETEAVLG